MKKTLKLLNWAFYLPIALCFFMVVLFESDILPTGIMKSDETETLEFCLEFLMIILTIAGIPMVLKMFKFPFVSRRITEDQSPEYVVYCHYSLIRILLLALLMVGNTLLYYLFMNVRFGYLAIILLISAIFIMPTKERVKAESGR
ncbi:hypothetical protein JHU38_11530 [Prevotella sp. A2931]|uniref:Uncharacterized protein n=1 Tax=Prevotella illustrans TaxID=2800387 RepID=A0ABS3M8F0_9BACT|nr:MULTISPECIES: hypothetical protein [Prevotella]MBO1364386.1 hypothetical protein [Prevotella illustrans]PTL25222.1 hypothetical protein C3V39_11060 [Prevotella sp. oral taxon 820]